MFESIKQLFSKQKGVDLNNVFSSTLISPLSKYKKNFNAKDFLNAYEVSLYANKAVNKRAEKIGEVKFIFKKGGEVVEEEDLTKLLYNPSPSFSGNEFWKLYQKYKDIFGEVYIYKNKESVMGGKKRVNSLQLLRSDLCKPKFSEYTGELISIEYSTGKKTQIIAGEDILYIHNPDPAQPLRGESLLKAGVRQIETGTQIDEYHSKVLENGGRVEGIFNFKANNLNKTQLQGLKDSYQEQYGDARASGLPLFLGGDASYTRLGLDPAELAYIETKQVNLDDIVYLTGVPKPVLGIVSGETYANADASIRIFLRETIKPLLDELVTALNNDPDISSEDIEISFIDPTPEDQEELRKNLTTADSIHALTINEKREKLNLDPIADGDVILVPMNLIPYQRQQEAPQQEKIVTKGISHPLQNKDTRRVYHALQLKRLDRRDEEMRVVLRQYFDGQEKRIIDQLEGVKNFKQKNLISEVFNNLLEIKLAKESVLPLLSKYLIEAGEQSKEISGSDFDFHATPDVTGWLDKKVDVFAKQINETTFKQLQNNLQESLDNGETRKELIGRIKDTYANNITKARAEVIARTEVHGVTQYGTLQGYKQAGLPIKIWTWAPGTKGGVRENHQSLDGEEAEIDANFSNGLALPGDGGASDAINCQCFI